MTVSLDKLPISVLKGVGPSMLDKLQKLGLYTLQDVLFHLPFRYQDRTRLSTIAVLRAGQEALIDAEILNADIVQGRRRSLVLTIGDGSGFIGLRFFHFSRQQTERLKPGVRLLCFGEVRRGPRRLEMVHPEYRQIGEDSDSADTLDQTLTPFYHTTEGVQQRTLRRLTDQALERLESGSLTDYLATAEIPSHWPDIVSALKIVHRPAPGSDVAALLDGTHPAYQRLILEELVAHRLGLRRLRVRARDCKAPDIRSDGRLLTALRDSLEFSLTGAQNRVLEEIGSDLEKDAPMLRLVQGDVGSGKTIVAAMAAAQVVDSGYQVAIMAPTEILAEQHLFNFSHWFEPLGIRVGWLSGKLSAAQRRAAIEAAAMGQQQIIVGTHALFQSDVAFSRLGLAIVDEQHRFGVHQRLALRNKGESENTQPHQLIMTATPIPRTLAMTAYADLDLSVIDELPPGRKPVTTVAIDNTRRPEVIERVNAAIAGGRQVYWVCTLIEESDSLQAEAAEDTFATLAESLPEHRVGLIHGRMKAGDKEAIMHSFKQRELDLLVATTVIEVGVDVPNASLMIIENAERLGLSQLHQLRGRVGRGEAQSTCILLYQAPLSVNARERLGIMRETNDGFLIAQKDLSLRGAGEVLGTRQTGLAEFRIASLGRDDHLLDTVSQVADRLICSQPGAVEPLIRRWIGEARTDYGGV